jgi:hypothetical protein
VDHDVNHRRQTVFEVNHANNSLSLRKRGVYFGITRWHLERRQFPRREIVGKNHARTVVAVFLLTAGSPALAQSRAWEPGMAGMGEEIDHHRLRWAAT